MKKLAGLLAALLFSILALAEPSSLAVPGQPLIIDVRTTEEYRAGHVREAINIPYDEIAARIAAVAPDRNSGIVLYCRSGRRSGIAEQALRQMGYRQVENKGGLNDMLQSGYQTDRGTVVCQAGSTTPCP
ncbi:MAG: rhodanese-like domain-containing protein [Candidatus Contendobacter sp.]|nr:rhodanese-like domain-containing protein [Candidatus Contendobacter sp.]MDS4058378.1 rhodanese-like domain-containing protein [Candidatus Contendobacter sp.]